MERKLSILVILLTVFTLNLASQTNLVLNPSFEDHTCCPHYQDMLYCCNHWYNPCNWNPDYFHTCGGGGFAPPHPIGGYQYPRTGDAYAGIHIYSWTNNLREYIAQRLAEPLKPNYDYSLGFYISYNNSSFALDLLGAAIVTDTFVCDHVTAPCPSLLNFTPQVCNPCGNVLMDTLNWVKISGTFHATGGERFLIIGDFFPDSLNTIFPWNWPWTNKIAYYLIDDVFLYELGPTGIGESDNLYNEIKFTGYPQPAGSIFYIQDITKRYSGRLQVDIFNTQGNICLHKKVDCNGGQAGLTISSLPAGVYFVRIYYSDKIQTIKLIKD